MIHRIYSDLGSFRELRFRPGLNLLVAAKGEGSTAKDAWNGAGKTSIVQLIHFLLGEKVDKGSIFQLDELAPWSFGLDFDLGGAQVRVRRSGTTKRKLLVARADNPSGSMLDAPDVGGTENTISDSDWSVLLGDKMFGLSGEQVETNKSLAPTFRSIFPYFARRHDSAGFVSHISHSSKSLHGTSRLPSATCWDSIGHCRNDSRICASERERSSHSKCPRGRARS